MSFARWESGSLAATATFICHSLGGGGGSSDSPPGWWATISPLVDSSVEDFREPFLIVLDGVGAHSPRQGWRFTAVGKGGRLIWAGSAAVRGGKVP